VHEINWNAGDIGLLRSWLGLVGFLEYCREFEREVGFRVLKGSLVDRLIANEPDLEEIVAALEEGAKDEARGVELSSSPTGASGDSSRE